LILFSLPTLINIEPKVLGSSGNITIIEILSQRVLESPLLFVKSLFYNLLCTDVNEKNKRIIGFGCNPDPAPQGLLKV